MVNRLREGVLWAGAVLGVLCIGWTVVMFAFGLTPLVFTSGSMSPQIKAGDLAFSRTIEASQIRVDDVVSVVNEKGVRITHRVVRVDPTAEGAVVTLKGDANQQADIEPYEVTTVERVSFSVPKAGYLVEAVGSPVGMFLGGLLAATALFIAFGGRGGSSGGPAPRDEETAPHAQEPPAGRRSGRNARSIPAAMVVATLTVAAASAPVQATQAGFTDSGALQAAAIGTALPSPSSVSCTGGGFLQSSIELRWAHVDARYDYRVVTRGENGAVLTTTDVVPTVAVGQTVTTRVTRSNLSGFLWFDLTATVQSKPKGGSSWVSTGTVYQYREGRIGSGSSIYCD